VLCHRGLRRLEQRLLALEGVAAPTGTELAGVGADGVVAGQVERLHA
jgi:hypothetical protein